MAEVAAARMLSVQRFLDSRGAIQVGQEYTQEVPR